MFTSTWMTSVLHTCIFQLGTWILLKLSEALNIYKVQLPFICVRQNLIRSRFALAHLCNWYLSCRIAVLFWLEKVSVVAIDPLDKWNGDLYYFIIFVWFFFCFVFFFFVVFCFVLFFVFLLLFFFFLLLFFSYTRCYTCFHTYKRYLYLLCCQEKK